MEDFSLNLGMPSTNTLQHNEARVTIISGTNREGYWKSEDMVAQLKEQAISIFEALHPGCKGTWHEHDWHECEAHLYTLVCLSLIKAAITKHSKRMHLLLETWCWVANVVLQKIIQHYL